MRIGPDGMTRFGTEHGLAGATIAVIFEDREGNLWMGSLLNGLSRFRRRTIETIWLVIDVRMPEVDGPSATHRVRAEFPAALIVVVSVHHNAEVEEAARQAGAHCFLHKSRLTELPAIFERREVMEATETTTEATAAEIPMAPQAARVRLSPQHVVTQQHSRFWDATDPNAESKSTHLWLVMQAVRSIRAAAPNDPRSVELERLLTPRANDTGTFGQAMRQGLWDADAKAPFNDLVFLVWGPPTWASHFYDPDTGLNFRGDKEPTALTQGTLFYWASLWHHHSTNVWDAGYSLGLSLHYLTDLTQPMHAANFTNLNLPFQVHHDLEQRALVLMNGNPPPSQTFTPGTDVSPDAYLIRTARDAKVFWPQIHANITHFAPNVHDEPIRAALGKGIANTARFLWLWISQSRASVQWGKLGDFLAPVRSPGGISQPAVVRAGTEKSTWFIRNSITDGHSVEIPLHRRRLVLPRGLRRVRSRRRVRELQPTRFDVPFPRCDWRTRG